MKYRSEIDGLRALAVIPVILFHAGFSLFQGGYVGVDVFFVISGYLITTIIIEKLKKDEFSFIDFYEKRIRRIFPVLFFVCLVTVPFSLIFLTPGDLDKYAQSLISIPLFLSNIIFWKQSGYFDSSIELKPLIHTWSLAVEEQYYILFPLFLFLAFKAGKRFTIFSLIMLFILSLSLAEWGNINAQSASFYFLPTRGFELLIGVFCAFLFERINLSNLNIMTRDLLGFIGLFLVFFSTFTFDSNTPVPGIHILIPTFGTALVILFSTKNTIVAKILSLNFFVTTGLISYSAYLWHQPILAFLKYQSIDHLTFLTKFLAVIIVFPLSYFSWLFIEQPFRRGKYIKQNIIPKYLLIFSLLIPIGLMILRINSGSNNSIINVERLLLERKEYSSGVSSNESDFIFNLDDKKYLIVGDSMWLDAVNIMSTVHNFKFDVSQRGGCPPHNNIFEINQNIPRECPSLNADRFSTSFDFSKYDGVIIIAMYSWFEPKHLVHYLDFLKSKDVENILVFGGYYSLDISVDRLMKFYKSSERLEQSFENHIVNKDIVSDSHFYNLQKKYDFQFISLKDSACINDNCKMFIDGKPYTIDTHHLSLSFTKLISRNNEDKIIKFFSY